MPTTSGLELSQIARCPHCHHQLYAVQGIGRPVWQCRCGEAMQETGGVSTPEPEPASDGPVDFLELFGRLQRKS